MYGSLLAGESHHGLLATARFVSVVRTEPCYELVDLGAYPALVEGGAASVAGELYEVDPVALAEIDVLEEHPTLYVRRRIHLADRREVDAYVMDRKLVTTSPRVTSSDWRRRREPPKP